MQNSAIEMLLWRDLAIFLLIFAGLGLLLGALLVFKPQLFVPLNQLANRWVSLRYISRLFDQTFSIERWFYRHHRVMGIAVMLGASYFLYYFFVTYDKAQVLLHLSRNSSVILLDTLLDAMLLAAKIGGGLAWLAGLIILLRPSLLRGIEKKSNRWVSMRRATKVFDVPRVGLDEWVMRHARSMGYMLLLSSLYLLFTMFRLLV
ncbi:MAG: hypothetical protein PXX73_08250 [Sideroxydans sp.]|nr:hypothetical protein [Sideroxydans sp.]